MPEVIPVRLEVKEQPKELRAKPVLLAPITAQPLVESTAMQSDRRSRRMRWLVFGCLLLSLGAGGLLFSRYETDKTASVKMSAVIPPKADGAGDRMTFQEAVKAGKMPVDAPKPLPYADKLIPPEGVDVAAMVDRTAAVLSDFLVAKNLEGRSLLMESRTSQAELAASILAKPLPAFESFQSQGVRFNKEEATGESLFLVKFAMAINGSDEHVIMVRVRGGQPPKVEVDPFLDCFGGRLKEFASSPREQTVSFQSIITVFDFCTNDAIPDSQHKQTMKMSDSVGGPDIAKAYFGAASPLREKIEKMGMQYGRAISATFTLKWNSDETTQRPFLEVVDVKSLDWDQ